MNIENTNNLIKEYNKEFKSLKDSKEKIKNAIDFKRISINLTTIPQDEKFEEYYKYLIGFLQMPAGYITNEPFELDLSPLNKDPDINSIIRISAFENKKLSLLKLGNNIKELKDNCFFIDYKNLIDPSSDYKKCEIIFTREILEDDTQIKIGRNIFPSDYNNVTLGDNILNEIKSRFRVIVPSNSINGYTKLFKDYSKSITIISSTEI